MTTPLVGTPTDWTQPFIAQSSAKMTKELDTPNTTFATAEARRAVAKKRRGLTRSARKPFVVLPTAYVARKIESMMPACAIVTTPAWIIASFDTDVLSRVV